MPTSGIKNESNAHPKLGMSLYCRSLRAGADGLYAADDEYRRAAAARFRSALHILQRIPCDAAHFAAPIDGAAAAHAVADQFFVVLLRKGKRGFVILLQRDRRGYAAFRGRSGSGFLHGFFVREQFVDGDMIHGRELFERSKIGFGKIVFPFGDGLRADGQVFAELRLREALPLAEIG